MKKVHFMPVLRHALTMVKRTLKSYALLSVTIVMSFALLLGYLLYTDAGLYNEYKEVFALPRSVLSAFEPYLQANPQRMAVLREKAKAIGNTYSMTFSLTTGNFDTYDDASGVSVGSYSQIYCIPNHAWAVYEYWSLSPMEITWLDGKEHSDVTLGQGEALMSEGIFYALGLDEMEEPFYKIKLKGDSSLTLLTLDVRIVGLIKDEYPLRGGNGTAFDVAANPYYDFNIVVSVDTLNPAYLKEDLWNWEQYTVFWTDSPEEVGQLCDQLAFDRVSVYEEQNAALEKIRTEKENKAVIACALLLLLGINLYSSFSNALNDRKFEIGVKRAIGASGWSIVRQFLYESLIVMAANILISVALVADVFIVYKYIYERTPDFYGRLNKWVIYISPHSVAMFSICAITLTVVFSLIFAYKSTRVEIVKYLKAE